jgi:hypothetical protein
LSAPYVVPLRFSQNREEFLMAFVQIIEFRTSKVAEMQAVADEWERATEGKRTARQRVLCQDRDNPGRYFNVVFFDSYEDAMENSALPETDAFSTKMMGFADGPPTFYNLDVLDDKR